jgi:hypothetical protein
VLCFCYLLTVYCAALLRCSGICSSPLWIRSAGSIIMLTSSKRTSLVRALWLLALLFAVAGTFPTQGQKQTSRSSSESQNPPDSGTTLLQEH